MLAIEANRVERNGKVSKNFVAWAEGFYAAFMELCSERLELPCSLAASIGLENNWRHACEQYAQQSFQELLELADSVAKSGLASAAIERAAIIRGKTDELTHAILKPIE